MRIVGIDPSLTATGIATPEQLTTLRPPDRLRGPARLVWIRDSLLGIIGLPDLVAVEGYSHASAHQAHQLGELGGVLRTSFHELGIPWVEIPPSTLKKFATGKGNATKDDMLVGAVRRAALGPQHILANHNEADAWWLHTMALYRYHHDQVATKYQAEALAKIDWPDLTARAAT